MTLEEKDLLEKDVNIGNKYLYDLCAKYDLTNIDDNINKDALSSQIWLIGRSYAASPERRSYTNKTEEKKELFKGSGRDSTFFNELANNLLNNSEFRCVLNELKTLKTKEYSFDENDTEKDISVLKQSILCVLKFNHCLRDDLSKMDRAQSNWGEIINFISFSSKFMHFHCPNAVFIKDSITTSNFLTKKTKKSNCYWGNLKLKEGDVEKISNNIKKDIESIITLNTVEKEEGKEGAYITHCCREYLLACELKELGLSLKTYYPRVVDTYMLKYRVVISK